jgi:hypothetical protein
VSETDDDLRAQARERLEKLVNSDDEKVARQASRALAWYGSTPAPGDPDYQRGHYIPGETEDRSAPSEDVAAFVLDLRLQARDPKTIETLKRHGWTPPR